VETYRKRFESFGWAAFKVDGHNLFEVVEAFEKCRNVKD
jgi:transketolase N-terminal domain/subunit